MALARAFWTKLKKENYTQTIMPISNGCVSNS
jgi:hypothetical protein